MLKSEFSGPLNESLWVDELGCDLSCPNKTGLKLSTTIFRLFSWASFQTQFGFAYISEDYDLFALGSVSTNYLSTLLVPLGVLKIGFLGVIDFPLV